MAKIRLTVSVDVNLQEMGTEYGAKKFTQDDARKHLQADLNGLLRAVSYADAIKDFQVK